MNLSLKTKVTGFIAIVVITVSAVSTLLSVSAHTKSAEREILARGIALSEALSRSVDEGLAAENLNLIKSVQDIVHSKDIVLTQIFSTLWLGVAAVPADQMNIPADPVAVAYFKVHANEQDHFYNKEGSWINVYSTIYLDSHDARIPKMLIGYVRLRISTEEILRTTRDTIISNVVAAALLTILAILFINAIIKKYVLNPLLNLHRSISKHKEGEFPETVPVETADEIGELSEEFNLMSRALKQREEKLAEEKERLSVTLRSIGDAVIVTDIEGTIYLLNKVAEEHTGWTAQEAIGRKLSDVFHIINEKTREACENPAEKVIQTGLVIGLANHTALIRKDGTEIIIEDSAAPIRDRLSKTIGIILVFRDATEKRRIEEEHLKVEKLESVGLLAGGLAHDFNNLLTSIVGNITMAKMYTDPNSKAFTRLAEAEIASRRATDLTYQLLTFSKGGAPIKKSTSIVDIIRESAAFTLSGSAIAPKFVVSNDTWVVDVDAGQMSQVFNNLIINAVQSMPHGGTVLFMVVNTLIAEQEVPTLDPGAYVKVSIQDSGTGIPAEHLTKIFDPYFTTKQKGNGLGLSSVYSIVHRHDGHITVESKPGQGSTFHIYLPASQTTSVSSTRDAQKITSGSGSVLVMDDEKIIRDIAGEMLRALGYDVDVAAEGKEALEKYQKALAEGRAFKAVIMDLTIPGGLGGKDAIRELRAIDPNVKAIVSSGYSNDPIMADYEKYGFKGVILKPYDIGKFSKTLSDIIGQ